VHLHWDARAVHALAAPGAPTDLAAVASGGA
jgi:hypothetical protein